MKTSDTYFGSVAMLALGSVSIICQYYISEIFNVRFVDSVTRRRLSILSGAR